MIEREMRGNYVFYVNKLNEEIIYSSNKNIDLIHGEKKQKKNIIKINILPKSIP